MNIAIIPEIIIAACNKYFGIQMAKYPQRMHDKTNAGLEEEKDLGGGIMKITNSFTFGTLGKSYSISTYIHSTVTAT